MVIWQKKGVVPACRIAVAGDFLPASGMQVASASAWRDCAIPLADYIGERDVTVLNLECCVDAAGCVPRPKLGLGDIFAAPRGALEFPRAFGAKLIGIANNHTFDFGDKGLQRTRKAVREAGLTPFGSVSALAESPDVAVAEIPGRTRIGFWAAARNLPEMASQTKAGIEPATLERGEEAVAMLINRGAALKVALIHAGLEHTNRPDPFDVKLLEELAQAGFEVVAACHSHRISGYKRVERADGTPAFCFFGLGSICSGVLYSNLEREGLVLVVGVDKAGEIADLELKPVYLDEYGFGRVPRPEEAAAIHARFARISEEIGLGTYQQRFYRDAGRDLFYRQYRDFRAAFVNGGILGLTRKLGRLRMRHLNRVLHKALG